MKVDLLLLLQQVFHLANIFCSRLNVRKLGGLIRFQGETFAGLHILPVAYPPKVGTVIKIWGLETFVR